MAYKLFYTTANCKLFKDLTAFKRVDHPLSLLYCLETIL
ncbi:hypothetical protein B0I21_11144 [Sphingobacterium paludis]|uniref:Uncharacterized protein n=1 Tax=Sphingobacterium paludis TaxID=1476465 RepID=A0A4R7CS81_9SPHI|nr:hypothetical protein B0I21_11144 [Sphingobacterium paludis]